MSQDTKPNTTSRRALLAGAPAAAIALAAGSALAVGEPADGLDWPAIILRAEGVVDRLKKYYGSEWSTADEEAAAGMLKHCRDHGPEDDVTGLYAALAFFERYNQSLDWVFRGDLLTMITDAAADSPRGEPEWCAWLAEATGDQDAQS
jgi:hypothetical protein